MKPYCGTSDVVLRQTRPVIHSCVIRNIPYSCFMFRRAYKITTCVFPKFVRFITDAQICTRPQFISKRTVISSLQDDMFEFTLPKSAVISFCKRNFEMKADKAYYTTQSLKTQLIRCCYSVIVKLNNQFENT